MRWTPAPLSPVRRDAALGTWLVLGDGDEAAALAARLDAAGARTTLVRSGAAFARVADRQFTVDRTSRNDFDRLLEDLGAERDSLRGAVHLWASEPASAEGAEADLRQTCGSLLLMAQALIVRGLSARRELWAVTRAAQPVAGAGVNPAGAALWGMMRALRAEHPDLRSVAVDLDAVPAPDAADMHLLAGAIAAGNLDNQLAYRAGQRYLPQFGACRLSDPEPSAAPAELAVVARGTLDNLQLRPMSRHAPGAGEVEIEVAAAGLNFRDVLNVLGMYPGDPGPLGSECVGTIARVGEGVPQFAVGQTVAAMTAGAFRAYVTADARVVAPVPEGLTVHEAATIPIAFMTALHSLVDLAGLQRGQRVLIHAGAGGVGLAAIQVAQRIGAEIFATAGSPEKRAYLESLGVPHVLDSRSLAFAA